MSSQGSSSMSQGSMYSDVTSLNSSDQEEKVENIYSSDQEDNVEQNISISRRNSLARTISKSIPNILKVPTNIGLQTDDPDELNSYLESHFEIGDALLLDVSARGKNAENEVCSLHTSNESVESPIDKKGVAIHENLKRYESKDTTLTKVFTNKSTGEIELPPDKGYAWVVVLSLFLVMFTTWGCNAAFGVFLSFFLANDTFPGATKFDYAIIAGLPIALCQLLSPVTIWIMRIIGIKLTMSIGCAFMLAGFLWASFAQHLWELYITQGLLIGISMALVSVPPTTCVPQWFLKKRAVSMGLSFLGTGVGGVVYGPICRKMIALFGNTQWCYRMLAISCTVLSVIGVILVRERVPQKPIGIRNTYLIIQEFKRLFDLKMVRRPVLILIALWFNLALFSYSLMVYTLAPYAVARGLTQDQGSTLTTILNAAQVIGRPTMGLIGDKWGRRNITCILTCVLSIFMFAFWIPAYSFLQLLFFAIMVGVCVGVANVMNPVLIADTVPTEEFLPAWGFVVYIGAGPLLCCEIVAQALTDESNKSNPYLYTQIFTGCLFLCACILSLLLREWSIRDILTKKNKLLKLHDHKELEDSDSSILSNDIKTVEVLERNQILLEPTIRGVLRRMVYHYKT